MGMSLFFTLSGFLITNHLINNKNITDFLLRRFFRIIPLAWLYILVVFFLTSANTQTYLAHLFFYANWPPMYLQNETSHFWSLCVEIQFYIAIAFIVTLLKDRGLMLIPVFCICFTLYRVLNDVHLAINTYYRIDEILAGGILALIYHNRISSVAKSILKKSNQYALIVLFIISCHPESGFMNYLRPYLGAALVGATLFNHRSHIVSSLNHKVLLYIATISYALYVIHGGLRHTWLGEGDTFEKYVKRPLLFAITFIMAHFSTFYYEKKCIIYGKNISLKLKKNNKG